MIKQVIFFVILPLTGNLINYILNSRERHGCSWRNDRSAISYHPSREEMEKPERWRNHLAGVSLPKRGESGNRFGGRGRGPEVSRTRPSLGQAVRTGVRQEPVDRPRSQEREVSATEHSVALAKRFIPA